MLCPAVIVPGLAVKLPIVGAGATRVTLTVTCFVVVPPAPVTESVYVVPMHGLTVVDPDVGTVPTPLSIVADMPPVLDQLSTDGSPPRATVEGLAVKLLMTGGATTTVTVTLLVA